MKLNRKSLKGYETLEVYSISSHPLYLSGSGSLSEWFVEGLFTGEFGFGGEESAGASFLRRNGDVWSTDKDGIILCLRG